MSQSQSPPQLRYAHQSLVVPGDLLGTIRQVRPGPGTYAKSNGHVCVSLAGKLYIEKLAVEHQADNENKMDTEEDTGSRPKSSQPQYTCSVRAVSQSTTNQLSTAADLVLKVGQVVVGVVTRMTPQMALVDIVLAQHVGPLSPKVCSYEGAIRMEDIRASVAADPIVLGQCFQPNDLVACRVVSLGDSRRYFLSTAETGLGVLRAKTALHGVPMIPVSWKEMECPVTGRREPRKVAKPISLKGRDEQS